MKTLNTSYLKVYFIMLPDEIPFHSCSMFTIFNSLEFRPTRVRESATKRQRKTTDPQFGTVQPEEGMMLYARLPQIFGATIRLHIEAQQSVIVLRLEKTITR